MLKRTVSYVDYNGNNQTDIVYFNMTKSEISRMQVKMDGKYIDHLQDLVEGRHVEELYDVFYNLVLDAYGEKSEDGKRFIKTPAMRSEFEQSIAFDTILAELIGDMDKMSEFSRKILPPDMSAQLPDDLTVPGLPE